MDALKPNMDVVSVPGQITGPQIVSDLLKRIASKLERHDGLRPTDCYAGYSCTATITLQFHDVYGTVVSTEVMAGKIDPKRDTQTITVEAEVEGEGDTGNLERPVDPSGLEEVEPWTPPQRQVPRRG